MRKIILSLGAILTFGFANAQDTALVQEEMDTAKGMTFKQGDMFLEGSVKITTGDTSNDYFAFTPKFGYFVNPKLAVGADLNFSSNKANSNDNKTTSFGVGLFARYYMLSLVQSRLKVYGEAGVGYNHRKTEIGGFSDDTNGMKANIDLGLNYFFTEHWAASFTLSSILSYNNASPESDEGYADNFELNINLFENIFATPQFGLMYKF